jgi:4-amino-4-deoxy-L-arabinose transferase-like glycosyltransferase
MRRSSTTTLEPILLGVVVASTATVLLRDPHGVAGVVAIGIGTAAATWLGTRDPLQLSTATAWTAVLVLAVMAVARAPMGSHDLWSYASYGRLVEHYHANPYHVVVARFRSDPVFRLVGGTWQHTPSAYGPLLVAAAAIVSRLAHANLVELRLGFQIPAALAVLACVGIVAHTTKRRAAIVLVGLQPMVWISVVNGAHLDVYVALAAVVAVALLRRNLVLGAGVVIGLAALIKISALFAVPVVLWFLIDRRRFDDARRFTAGVGAFLAVALLVAPSSFTSAARATHGIVSRSSPWRLLVLAHLVSSDAASMLGLVAGAVIVAEIARRNRGTTDLAGAVALALATYAIVAGFTLPWYAMWSMPVAAMSARRSVAVVTALHGAILLAAYQAGTTSALGRVVGGLISTVAPVVTVAILLVLVATKPKPAPGGYTPAAVTIASVRNPSISPMSNP